MPFWVELSAFCENYWPYALLLSTSDSFEGLFFEARSMVANRVSSIYSIYKFALIISFSSSLIWAYWLITTSKRRSTPLSAIPYMMDFYWRAASISSVSRQTYFDRIMFSLTGCLLAWVLLWVVGTWWHRGHCNCSVLTDLTTRPSLLSITFLPVDPALTSCFCLFGAISAENIYWSSSITLCCIEKLLYDLVPIPPLKWERFGPPLLSIKSIFCASYMDYL